MINYSIIIPHYNIPDLLVRCLKSIPIREDVQIIVVDDCSPDYETYKDRYPELSRPYLELYQTPMGGSAGRARNLGLNHAKGKWLIFLDADDLLSEDAETILDDSVKRTEDILFYNTRSVMCDDMSRVSKRNMYAPYFAKYKFDKDEYLFRYRFHALWGKIFNNAMIEKYGIRFSETKYANDVYFSTVAGHYANFIRVDERVFYIVTERRDSLASSQFNHQKPGLEECEIRLKEAIKVRRFVERVGIKNFDIQVTHYLSDIRRYYTIHYFKYLFKYTLLKPSYVLPFYLRDLEYIFKRLNLFDRK